MITEKQQVDIFNRAVPAIEEELVLKGLNRDQALGVAVEWVLEYIVEAQDELGPALPTHSFGIKIGPGTGHINLFLTFKPGGVPV